MSLPPRTPATMIDAIALSSPSGRMSKRARNAAQHRLSVALFGERGLVPQLLPIQPTHRENLLYRARELRDLAARGMSVRRFIREAQRLEAEALEV